VADFFVELSFSYQANSKVALNPTGIQANFESYKINTAAGDRVRIDNGNMSINK